MIYCNQFLDQWSRSYFTFKFFIKTKAILANDTNTDVGNSTSTEFIREDIDSTIINTNSIASENNTNVGDSISDRIEDKIMTNVRTKEKKE